ncbi:MAG: polyphosphate kinase 1 [Bacteroidetes bacterium]|nr:polyphosphate kinase 1 [Bacteroidota bacterium]
MPATISPSEKTDTDKEGGVYSPKTFDKSEHFTNRELSWLEFNRRVLEEAQDPTVPLIERLKFLAIFSSNLDEFFMVRVAGVRRQIDANVLSRGPDGMLPREVMDEMSRRIRNLVEIQREYFFNTLLPLLKKENIRLLKAEDLNPDQTIFVHDFFNNTVSSILTPLAIDPSHPFPHLTNRTLCIIAEVRPSVESKLPKTNLVVIPVSTSVIPRFVRLPSANGEYHFMSIEDLIRVCVNDLFRGYDTVGCFTVRVTRDSDLQYDEDPSEDLIKTIAESLRNRRKGAAVRLQYEDDISDKILKLLIKELDLEAEDLYPAKGAIGLGDLMQLYNELDKPDLKDIPIPSTMVREFETGTDMFSVIRHGDVMVHHPYQSFSYVTRFVREAAEDPKVLAIKMTLYRIAADSEIAQALQLAAERGKQVAVLVELKARFDEEANITWAKKLEDAGAHVMYGMAGLKTHCKVCLVIRQEKTKIRRYCHLSTGNYNDRTSVTYGDIGLFSAHPRFGEDLTNLFNVLTGYSAPPRFHRIKIAPTELRETFVNKIRREVSNIRDGKPALIIAKMNSLVDKTIILELFRASQAGVTIKLVIRGICCLKPGIKGVSENIEVVSIIDRFLEHARIFYFQNDSQPEYWLASSDWMPRNLDQRIEVAFPIKEPKYQNLLWNILQIQLADNVKARKLLPEGIAMRVKNEKKKIRSQVVIYELFKKELGRP